MLVAFLAPAGPGLSRVFAVLAALGGALLVWRDSSRVPGLLRTDPARPAPRRTGPWRWRVYAVAAGPVLLLLYALVGTPWPLVAAIAAAALAEFAVFARSPR